MLPLTNAQKAIISGDVLTIATLWEIHRNDGVVLLFTDHDESLVFAGRKYSPIGSFNASALQKPGGLKERNRELVGTLTSDAISHEDLLAGLYRDAAVKETLIDWTDVTGPLLYTNVFWITETSFSGQDWNAVVMGITGWLTKEVGSLYSRKCKYRYLGQGGCGVDPSATEIDITVSSVETDNLEFTTADLSSGNYFTGGQVVWESGANEGIVSVVKTHLVDQIYLWLQTPFPIAPGDQATIRPACDGHAQTCLSKFSNFVNFGGYPHIPGSDRYYLYPNTPQEA